MHIYNDLDERIESIASLKRQDSPQIAKEMLENVYRFVLPIMRRRNFRVRSLVEFLPKNPNLLGLNVNHGQKISLRLRYHHNPREFLSFESVLGTMLHELCHNVHGPHDSKFFKLLDELTAEMETMIARGFNGDPFIGQGRQLGIVPVGTINQARRQTLAFSQTESRTSNTAPKARRGRKLGGLGASPRVSKHSTIRELALQAAERRRVADKFCKTSKNSGESNGETEEIIDLTGDDELHTGNEINEREVIYLLDD